MGREEPKDTHSDRGELPDMDGTTNWGAVVVEAASVDGTVAPKLTTRMRACGCGAVTVLHWVAFFGVRVGLLGQALGELVTPQGNPRWSVGVEEGATCTEATYLNTLGNSAGAPPRWSVGVEEGATWYEATNLTTVGNSGVLQEANQCLRSPEWRRGEGIRSFLLWSPPTLLP